MSGIEQRCRAVGSLRVGVRAFGEQLANLGGPGLLRCVQQFRIELRRARRGERDQPQRREGTGSRERSHAFPQANARSDAV
jgi:hypothetical protein